MKSLKVIITLVTLFLSVTSNGQTVKPLPQFQNDVVVVRTFEESGAIGWTSILNVTDGTETKYSMELSSLKPKTSSETTYVLAQIFNYLKTQKYKLVGTNGGGGGGGGSALLVITNYVFQKE